VEPHIAHIERTTLTAIFERRHVGLPREKTFVKLALFFAAVVVGRCNRACRTLIANSEEERAWYCRETTT
jgi:hypothetical protein